LRSEFGNFGEVYETTSEGIMGMDEAEQLLESIL
jgi:hypothetical protein